MVDSFDFSWFYGDIDDAIDLSIEKVGTKDDRTNTISSCDDTSKPGTKHIE